MNFFLPQAIYIWGASLPIGKLAPQITAYVYFLIDV